MKMIKKIISFNFIIIFSLLLFTQNISAAGYTPTFDLASDAVLLVNQDTNTILYEKNADKVLFPASLAKIMTAIITIEYCNNNQVDIEKTIVKAPAYIYDELVSVNASTADIRPGEEVSIQDLLYAMILPSSCEASSILADYIGGGSIPTFVEAMNKRAKELGANSTVYTNAHGLHDPNQVTTARDLYLITKHAMSLPLFAKIWGTAKYQMPVTSFHPKNNWVIYHTVRMLNPASAKSIYYSGTLGAKSGSTEAAGRNLISTVTKNGYTYLLVTLGAQQPTGSTFPIVYTEHRKLYDWAFSDFKLQTVIKADDLIGEAKVKLGLGQDYVGLITGEDISILLPVNSDTTSILKDITTSEGITAPIKKGDVLGQVELKVSDSIIATVPLIAAEDVSSNPILYWLNMIVGFFDSTATKIIAIITVIIIIILILFIIRYKRILKRRDARRRAALRGK